MKIDFLIDKSKVDLLVDLFIKKANVDYITHIEIEEGRAISTTQWSDNLKDVLKKELLESCTDLRLITISDDEEINGYALLRFNEDSIIIEDIIVNKKGLGKELILWIENYSKMVGFKRLIGDVGCRNEVAKSFMSKLGFQEQTITYVKNIH